MTLHIPLSQETEAMLRQKAQAAGTDVEGFVRQVIEEQLMTRNDAQSTPSTPRSHDQWIERFDAWVNSHPIRPNVNLDDSRERIYGGRGE
jgi:hypothetical protein